MSAPPNPSYTTSKNDVQNGSAQEKGQATYPPAGYCSRCVRICINCQHGTSQQSGFPPPPPASNPMVFQQQQQQQNPITCQCPSRLLASHSNSGYTHNAFPGPACTQKERLPTLVFDQPTRGSVQYDQRTVQTLSLDYFQRESGLAPTIAEATYRPSLMQGKITEEPTVDENTEKTSVLPSRGSAPSTWQEVSRLGRLEGESASEREPQEEGVAETVPSQSPLISEDSSKELRSGAMQADLLQDQNNQPSSILKDNTENISKRVKGPDECDENNSRPEPNMDDYTLPERPSWGQGRCAGQDLRRRQAEQASCQRVNDCLQKCYERLEVIQQHASDRNALGNTLCGYCPQQRYSVDNGSQVASTLTTALPDQVPQMALGQTCSQAWVGNGICSSTEQNAFEEVTASECPPQPAMIRNCSEEQEEVQSDISREHKGTSKSSVSKLSSEFAASKHQTTVSGGHLQSDSSGQKSAHLEEPQNKTESVASKQQQTSMNSDPLPSHSVCIKSFSSEEKLSQTESHPLTTRISDMQSDAAIIGCNLTRQNLSLCKHFSDSYQNQLPSGIQDIGELVQLQPEEAVCQEAAALRILSKQSEMITSSYAAKALEHQEREPSEITKTERVISGQDSGLKMSCSQQEWASKQLTSQQETALKNSSSTKEWDLKRATPHQDLASKDSEYEECVTKNSASQGHDSKTLALHEVSPSKEPGSQEELEAEQESASQKGQPSKNSPPSRHDSVIKISELRLPESSGEQKQQSAQPSELCTKTESRTQVLENQSESSKKSGQLKEHSQRPNAHSSNMCVTISPESKKLQIEETVREMTRWMSDSSRTPPSSDRKLGSDATLRKTDMPKSSPSALLSEERRMLSATKATSKVALPSQTSVTKTLMKEKTPPRTADSAKYPWQKQSKGGALSQKPSKDTPRKTDEDTSDRKIPLKEVSEAKTSKKGWQSIISDQEKRLSSDGSQSSPYREHSSIAGQKSSLSTENLDQTDGLKPQSYCLHAYCLPLYQCAFCKQITPYPVTCQMGVVNCCPSPYDLPQRQPCYKPSPPSCLPWSCQGYQLPYPQPQPLDPSESDPTSQTKQLEKCPQPELSCSVSKVYKEPAKQTGFCQLPRFQPIEQCKQQCFQSTEPCRKLDRQISTGTGLPKTRSESIKPCQQACYQPAKSCPISNQKVNTKQKIENDDRRKSKEGNVHTNLGTAKPSKPNQEPCFQSPAYLCQRPFSRPSEPCDESCLQYNLQLSSESAEPPPESNKKLEVQRKKNYAKEKYKKSETKLDVSNTNKTNTHETTLEEHLETNKPNSSKTTKLEEKSESAGPCQELCFQPGEQLCQIGTCQEPCCPSFEPAPQSDRRKIFETAEPSLKHTGKSNSLKENKIVEKTKNDGGKAKFNEVIETVGGCQHPCAQRTELCQGARVQSALSCQQTCSQPPELSERPCFEPAKPCLQENQDNCPIARENVTCPTSTSYLTCIEPCICKELPQPCDQPCRASERGNGGGAGGVSNDEGENSRRSSKDSHKYVLKQNSKSKLTIGSSTETKRSDVEEYNYKHFKDENPERSTVGRASFTSEQTNKSRKTSGGGAPEKESDAKEKSKKDGGKTSSNEGPNKKLGKGLKVENYEGQKEIPRREAVYKKGNYEKDSDMKKYSDKKGKFRREKTDDRLEDLRRKGSGTKSHRSPHRTASAESGSSLLSYQTNSDDGKPRNVLVPDLQNRTEGQVDRKVTKPEIGDRRKTGRSSGQIHFERPIVGPTGSYRGIGRALHYQLSPSFQISLPKSTLRNNHLVQMKKDLSPRTEKIQPKKDSTQIERVLSNLLCPLSGDLLDAKGGVTRRSSPMFQNSSSQQLSSQCSQRFGRSNDISGQRSVTETKDGQIRIKGPFSSHIPSSVDASSASNERHRSSRRYPYTDREQRRNIFSPYYLTPRGAPHRAICSVKRNKLIKRLQLNDHAIKALQFSQQNQPKVGALPSSSSSASSKAEDLASYQSEDPNCCLWQESQCSCATWLNKAPFPKHNCCAHAWTNAPHCMCPLHSHLLCPNANCLPSVQGHPTKAKPKSLRSQRTRRVLMRGKRLLGERKPR